jgi:hypothetical protein
LAGWARQKVDLPICWKAVAFANVGPLGWPGCTESIAEIDGDIAAYRGLKPMRQTVEIGMVEIVAPVTVTAHHFERAPLACR